MISHTQMKDAMRTHALTLEVAATGSASLEASVAGGQSGASAYIRTTGSFVTDGFCRGMEVVAAGFATGANNGTTIITAVSALMMTVAKVLTADVAAASRTLTVGIPAGVGYENVKFEPTTSSPYWEEEYLPGPAPTRITTSTGGEYELRPVYIVKVSVPENSGSGAAQGYADALVGHFVGEALALDNGDTLRVSTERAPMPGQLLQTKPGFASVPVTIPFVLRTTA